MRFALLLTLLLQDPKPPEPRPTLPPVRLVTLTLDRVPAKESLKKFQSASGFLVTYRASHRDDEGLDDREMSLKLDAVPFVRALPLFCQAHGEIGFDVEWGAAYVGWWLGGRATAACYRDLFGFEIARIEEELSTDFSEERRSLSVQVVVWWQPDLTVFSLVGVRVEEAVDDKGNDLLVKDSKSGRNEASKLDLSLALPPKEAVSITHLRGTIEIEVPGEVFECVIKDVDKEKFGPIKLEGYVVSGTRSDLRESRVWVVKVEPAEKGGTVLGLTEARVVRGDGKVPEGDQVAGVGTSWGSSLQEAWFRDEPGGEVSELRFKIVKSKAKLIVPFEFKDVKLPRSK